MENITYLARQARRALQVIAESITDESTMLEVADIYPDWEKTEKAYKVGAVVKYGTNTWGETQLYQCLQAHTSQANWTPDTAVSLWKAVGFSGEYPLWTQPLGSTDAYDKGDVVKHNDKVWSSDVAANVWEPGVYGWTETE